MFNFFQCFEKNKNNESKFSIKFFLETYNNKLTERERERERLEEETDILVEPIDVVRTSFSSFLHF
jgi:hypothetical protein